MGNQLYYSDNLEVLRKHIASDSVDLVYLDPPFNSNQDYSVIFKNTKGQGSEAQARAFVDTWHWGAVSQLPPLKRRGLVSRLHRNSAYLCRRAALVSLSETSGVTDKNPVLIQSCRMSISLL